MALAVLDLDGTVIDGQSQRMLLSYLRDRGEIGLREAIRITTWFIGYNLGLTTDPAAVMQTAFSFLNGWTEFQADSLGQQFFRDQLSAKIYPRAYELAEQHKNEEHKIILVSNAVEFVVRPVAEALKCHDYFCTKLEIQESRYTGRVSGKLMYGPAKTAAVTTYAEGQFIQQSDIWAYGDHHSDSFLLASVGHPVATNPTKKMLAIAIKNGWQVIDL